MNFMSIDKPKMPLAQTQSSPSTLSTEKMKQIFGNNISQAVSMALQKTEYNDFMNNEKLVDWVLERIKEDLLQAKDEGEKKISPEELSGIVDDRMADAISRIGEFQEFSLEKEIEKYDFSGKKDLVISVLNQPTYKDLKEDKAKLDIALPSIAEYIKKNPDADEEDIEDQIVMALSQVS